MNILIHSQAWLLSLGNGKDRTNTRVVPEIARMGASLYGEEPQSPRLKNSFEYFMEWRHQTLGIRENH
jgi:hypothetical protein